MTCRNCETTGEDRYCHGCLDALGFAYPEEAEQLLAEVRRLQQLYDNRGKRIEELAAEVERLKQTNARLNRRAQQAESCIAKSDQWRWGWRAGTEQTRKQAEEAFLVKQANQHASRLGEKNKQLKERIKELEIELAGRGGE